MSKLQKKVTEVVEEYDDEGLKTTKTTVTTTFREKPWSPNKLPMPEHAAKNVYDYLYAPTQRYLWAQGYWRSAFRNIKLLLRRRWLFSRMMNLFKENITFNQAVWRNLNCDVKRYAVLFNHLHRVVPKGVHLLVRQGAKSVLTHRNVEVAATYPVVPCRTARGSNQ